MSLNTPLLEIKDLHVSIDNNEILKNMNLTINKGEKIKWLFSRVNRIILWKIQITWKTLMPLTIPYPSLILLTCFSWMS